MIVRLKNHGLRYVADVSNIGGVPVYLCIEGGGFVDIEQALAETLIASEPERFSLVVVPEEAAPAAPEVPLEDDATG